MTKVKSDGGGDDCGSGNSGDRSGAGHRAYVKGTGTAKLLCTKAGALKKSQKSKALERNE